MLTFSKAANTHTKKKKFLRQDDTKRKRGGRGRERASSSSKSASSKRESGGRDKARDRCSSLFTRASLSLSLSLLDVIISMRGAKKNEEVKTKPPCVFCCVPKVFSSSLSSLSSLSSS